MRYSPTIECEKPTWESTFRSRLFALTRQHRENDFVEPLPCRLSTISCECKFLANSLASAGTGDTLGPRGATVSSMKQALQLKLGQQLALTPQLQQAIKLLQLSTIDLQQTIEETLESNALLERDNELAEQDGIDFSAG